MSSFIYHTLSKGKDGENYADEFITSALLNTVLVKGLTLHEDGVFPERVIYEIEFINNQSYPVSDPEVLKMKPVKK